MRLSTDTVGVRPAKRPARWSPAGLLVLCVRYVVVVASALLLVYHSHEQLAVSPSITQMWCMRQRRSARKPQATVKRRLLLLLNPSNIIYVIVLTDFNRPRDARTSWSSVRWTPVRLQIPIHTVSKTPLYRKLIVDCILAAARNE